MIDWRKNRTKRGAIDLWPTMQQDSYSKKRLALIEDYFETVLDYLKYNRVRFCMYFEIPCICEHHKEEASGNYVVVNGKRFEVKG